MTQPETDADDFRRQQIAKARDLMADALALLDAANASLPAVHLDRALAALVRETSRTATLAELPKSSI